MRKIIYALIALVVASCSAAEGEDAGQYRTSGIARIGGEHFTFQKCGSRELWALSPDSFFGQYPGWEKTVEIFRSPRDCETTNSGACPVRSGWIDATVLVSNEGGFGHLSKYDREVSVIELHSALAQPPADCRLPAPVQP